MSTGERSPRPMSHTPSSMLRNRISGRGAAAVPRTAAAPDPARVATDRWVTDGGTVVPADAGDAS